MPFDRSVVCNLCQTVCYIPKDLVDHLDSENHKIQERKLERAKNKYLREQGLAYESEDDMYEPSVGGPNRYMNGPRGYANGPKGYADGPKGYANGPRDQMDYRHGPKDYMQGQNSGVKQYSSHERRNTQGPKRH